MKLNSKTLGHLMIRSTIEHPDLPMLHMALEAAFHTLERKETELQRAIEARVEEQNKVNAARANERRNKYENFEK